MRVIGVLDLRGGRAVHARAGARNRYRPVDAVGGEPVPQGDPVALAHAYTDRLGVRELYIADLDAIEGGKPQDSAVVDLVRVDVPVWLDAGIASVAGARHAVSMGAAHVVVGLETLPSFAVLEEVSSSIGRSRVAFSLDLRNGAPVLAPNTRISGHAPPEEIAALAAGAGAGATIVLDLARVGTGLGPDFGLIAGIRKACPGMRILAGGGTRGPEDLGRLGDLGCDGALVATALQDGRLRAKDLAGFTPGPRSS